MASLAEQVLPLTSTYTRDRFSVGSGSLRVHWNSRVRHAGQVSRSRSVEFSLERLLLNTVLSNTWLTVRAAPAIM